jgi:hypothetical protein
VFDQYWVPPVGLGDDGAEDAHAGEEQEGAEDLPSVGPSVGPAAGGVGGGADRGGTGYSAWDARAYFWPRIAGRCYQKHRLHSQRREVCNKFRKKGWNRQRGVQPEVKIPKRSFVKQLKCRERGLVCGKAVIASSPALPC